tara:strand:+ start:652 stop:798 length:147 start_codon:yes stop_codon:yes gene_type:complete
MTSCRNCGHESHCGQKLKKDLGECGEEVQICYSCFCEKCEPPVESFEE